MWDWIIFIAGGLIISGIGLFGWLMFRPKGDV